jgi:MBG domain (YGX type)/Bacterial Ig-like domain (group 3)/IPT/TIG domain
MFKIAASALVLSSSRYSGRRRLPAAFACLAMLVAFAASAHAGTTITVTSTASSGTGSLSAAITQANTDNDGDTINFSLGATPATITLTSALPAITGSMTIAGPGAGNLTISGNSTYTVFTVNAGATVSISGLTIANGYTASDYTGAGISNEGSLTVNDCVFAGNSGSAGYTGGGIANVGETAPATLTVINSTFTGNSSEAGAGGGGILNLASGAATAAVTVTNSTFSGNSATSGDDSGGIISFDSPTEAASLTVSDSTFSGNSASGGDDGGAVSVIYSNSSSTVSVFNSVFSGNSGSGGDSAGGISAGVAINEGNNLFYNNTGGNAFGSFTLSGTDVTGQDPMLLALGNYGGPTQTMLPLQGSPAICAGSSSAVPSGVTTDQRGFPLNSANCSNSGVDIGSVQTNYLTVTTNQDLNDGSCTATVCSLRDAMSAANLAGGGDIDFAASLNGETITLSLAVLPTIVNPVNVIGPGANELTVSGANNTSIAPVFSVSTGIEATFYGLTITGGNSGGSGAGINNAGSNVTIINSAISGNATPSGYGAGLLSDGGTVMVSGSTFSGNSAAYGGGGIQIDGGTVNVSNSTFSGNTATGSAYGGGIENNGGTVMVTNSTLSANSAPGGNGGGIENYTGTLLLANDIVAGNTASVNADVDGTYTNVIGNVIGTTPIDLTALGNYGGTTQTMIPLTGSPALNAGTYQTGEPTTDQRGDPRPTSGAIDAGSVQISGEPPVVEAVTPDQGPAAGGTSVVITGTGMDAATAVMFGSTAATSFTITPATSTTPAYITATSPAESVGTVDITVTNAAGTSATNSNDEFTYVVPSVTITPASEALSGTYGTAYSQTFTAAGGSGSYTLTNAGTVPPGLSLTASATGWTLAGTPTAVGNYSFSLTATDSTNSADTLTETYTLTVSQAPLTVTVNNTSRAYGAANPTFTGTVTGLVNGDTATSIGLAYSTTATTSSAVGTYPITATITSTNYTLTVTPGTLTVTAAPLTVTVNNASRAYGAANPTFTGTVTGLVNGDTATSIGLAYSTTATASSAVGTYPITATITSTNYMLTVVPGTLTITQVAPVITWAAPAAITYGTPLGAAQLDATATYNSAAVAGTFTYTPAAGTVLGVGANQTLSVTFVPSNTTDYSTPPATTTTITVTQATLDVTANNATRVYGTANPTFSGSVTGAVNGNTFTESFSTTATTTSNAGTYAIVPSVTGADLSDYTVDITNGTLTVTQAGTTTTLSANASTINPGQSVTLTAQVQSDTTGTPTGTVNFYDGTTLLGSATLSAGSASFTTSALTAGVTNSLTAAYQGNIDFTGSTSSSAVSIPVTALDFTLTIGGVQSETITGGSTATFTFDLSPTYGVYPSDVTFSASGLPSGAIVTFSPTSIAANGGAQAVVMQIQTTTSDAKKDNPFERGGTRIALGFLLLPLLGMRRVRNSRLGRGMVLLLVVAAGAIGLASLSGCGSSSTMGQSSGQSYTITFTATSGSVQHSGEVSLRVNAN